MAYLKRVIVENDSGKQAVSKMQDGGSLSLSTDQSCCRNPPTQPTFLRIVCTEMLKTRQKSVIVLKRLDLAIVFR